MQKERTKAGRRYSLWIILVAVALLFWYLRTWWHGPLMLIYRYPVVWEALLVWCLLHRFFFSRMKTKKVWRYTDSKGKQAEFTWRLNWVSYFLLFFFLFVFVAFGNISTQLRIFNDVAYEKLETLPEATDEVRLMPQAVAYRYARDALQLSQYKLGTQHIALVNGSLSWTFPLVPDGLVLTFTAKSAGMTFVNATTMEKNSQVVWQKMLIGEGMEITDNLWWKLYRKRYFIDTESPYYLPSNGQVYTIVPVISYSYHLRWGLLYTVPRFAGSFLVSGDGSISFLTPKEARQHPLLSDNLIFPERLSRTYVLAYQYEKGAWNRFFMHADQIQLQDVGENQQPFLMNTRKGLKWFVSTEPYGESHGVFKIFIVDAGTGKIELYELAPDEVLTGPVRAMDYVRRSNPVVDWTRFEMVEPLPFIRDGVLYWKATVVPIDAAGIAYQAFVDSRNNQVYEASTDAQAMAFIEGRIVDDNVPGNEESPADLLKEVRRRLMELQQVLDELEAAVSSS